MSLDFIQRELFEALSDITLPSPPTAILLTLGLGGGLPKSIPPLSLSKNSSQIFKEQTATGSYFEPLSGRFIFAIGGEDVNYRKLVVRAIGFFIFFHFFFKTQKSGKLTDLS
ncbi:hypothetical protein WDW37_00810 [Bdellovibrionota bacterium FG-1]